MTRKLITEHIVEEDSIDHQLLVEQSEIEKNVYRIGYKTENLEDWTELPFQRGPINEVGVNGITNESVIAIIIDRLREFQMGKFSCRENAIALTHLEEALMWLQKRTRNRISRGVEGTNQQ